MQPAPHTTSTPPLALALSLAGEDLRRVDALILQRVAAEIPLIKEIAQHIIASGGKRLRPLLTLLAARACGYNTGDRHVNLAACVEFIHTATLLHDDVVDESALRRGLATANAVFGNKASVLVGDFLLAQAFQLMVIDGIDSLRILSDAAAIIARGEVKQLMTEGAPETPKEQYLDVIACKTAALFASACELGGIVSGCSEMRAPLRAYGEAIGIAFQLVDDALDYSADQATLGKTVGDDFREGKITLPVIHAWAAGTEQERAFWRRTLEAQEQREGDLAAAIEIINKNHSISASLAEARRYCETATAALTPLPTSPAKEALLEIVDFCVKRSY